MDNQSVSTENVDVGFDSDQSSSEVGSGTSTATSATGNLEKGLTPKLSSLSAKTDYAGTLPVVIADGKNIGFGMYINTGFIVRSYNSTSLLNNGCPSSVCPSSQHVCI